MPNEEPFMQTNEYVLSLKEWENQDPSLVAGFSTKHGGVSHEPYKGLNVGFHVKDEPSAVLKNRERVADLLGFPLSNWVVGEQVHKGNIAKIHQAHKSSGAFSHETAIPSVDGLYTTERDILLVSLYADCVPLFFYVPSKQIIGLAHAGWKGTVENIGSNMIQTMIEKEGVELDDIHVAIGPSISQEAYEVNLEVAEKIRAVLPNPNPEVVIEVANHKYHVNLKEANKQLLLAIGIKEKQIKTTNYCTSNDEDLFFSYRRDHGITGRMMSFIGFKSYIIKGETNVDSEKKSTTDSGID